MSGRALAIAVALLGLAFLGQGMWIPCKALLAQHLLRGAWHRAQAGEAAPLPWTWADTWPVARLEFPRLGEHSIVLAGASGSTLAFGPGHLAGSARPGDRGNTVIAGHRDTHFAFLQDLVPGDELVLTAPEGGRRSYFVDSLQVVDQLDTRALEPTDEPVLTLVTCYPFGAVVPGGPLRYVVRASESIATRSSLSTRLKARPVSQPPRGNPGEPTSLFDTRRAAAAGRSWCTRGRSCFAARWHRAGHPSARNR